MQSKLLLGCFHIDHKKDILRNDLHGAWCLRMSFLFCQDAVTSFQEDDAQLVASFMAWDLTLW